MDALQLVGILMLFGVATLLLIKVTKLEKQIHSVGELKQELSNAVLQQIKEETNQVMQQTESRIDNINTTVKSQLDELMKQTKTQIDTFINEEQLEINKWIESIQSDPTDIAGTVEKAESALNKYPSNRTIMEMYKNLITKLIYGPNPIIRKHAIERYNRASRVFLDNCKPEDFAYAKELLNDSLKLGNELMNEVNNKRLAQTEQQIVQLESKMRELMLSEPSKIEKIIDAIEELDSQIDRDFLKNYRHLQARYEKVSKQLMQQFAGANITDEGKIQQYNRLAVDQIQQAYNLFQQDEKTYKNGTNLYRLVNKLGGWDTTYLTPATQVYFQSVYNEIFGKLQPAVKPTFTLKMLEEPKKEIS